jgi:hypothetical protein
VVKFGAPDDQRQLFEVPRNDFLPKNEANFPGRRSLTPKRASAHLTPIGGNVRSSRARRFVYLFYLFNFAPHSYCSGPLGLLLQAGTYIGFEELLAAATKIRKFLKIVLN